MKHYVIISNFFFNQFSWWK